MPFQSSEFSRLAQEAASEETSGDRLYAIAYSSISAAQLVASNPTVPALLLTELATWNDELTRQNVTKNPNTPSKVLFQLGEKYPSDLLSNPILPLLELENPNLVDEIPSETLVSLLNYSLNNPDDQPSIPENWLKKLGSNRNPSILNLVAQHPKTPVSVLEEIVLHREIRDSLAKNTHLPLDLIEKWALANNWDIRVVAALCPKTPVYLLEKLAQDYFRYVRVAVAENPQTPIYLLEQLAQKNNQHKIRAAVASSPRATIELLSSLAEDNEWLVRKSVACNPKTPLLLLEKLLTDEDYRVRQGIIYHPEVTVVMLEKLAADKDEKVRKETVGNHHLPIYLLKKLARDRARLVNVAAKEKLKKHLHSS